MTQREAMSLLEANGWEEQQGGKHSVKMVKEGHRPITLPTHRRGSYGKRLTSAILRQAGLKGGDDA